MLNKILLIALLLPTFCSALVINEIMYNPDGPDEGNEWVEIFNDSASSVEIKSGRAGFRFFDGENHLINPAVKGSLNLAAGGFLILSKDPNLFLAKYPNFSGNLSKASFSLKNTAATLRLLNENSAVLNEFSYSSNLGANGNGLSLGREADSIKESKPTPGAVNNFKIVNSNQAVSLLPSTTLPATPLAPSSQASSSSSSEIPKVVYSSSVIINEFLPNPSGVDENQEWIELFNEASEEVDLTGWKLKTSNSKAYPLLAKIPALGFLVVSNADSKIAIKNSGDEIMLLNSNNEISFSIKYSGQAKENYAFARFGQNDWRWTKKLTPGQANIYEAEVPGKKPKLTPAAGSLTQTTSSFDFASTTSSSSLVYPILSILILAFGAAVLIFR